MMKFIELIPWLQRRSGKETSANSTTPPISAQEESISQSEGPMSGSGPSGIAKGLTLASAPDTPPRSGYPQGQWTFCREAGLTVHIHCQNGDPTYRAWVPADDVEALIKKMKSSTIGPDIDADTEFLMENPQETKAP